MRGGDGQIVKWVGTATDIDDARQSEADLQLAHRATAETLTLVETLHSKAPIGFGFVDRDFRVVRVNETLAAINGSTVAEHLGKKVVAVMPSVFETPQIQNDCGLDAAGVGQQDAF